MGKFSLPDDHSLKDDPEMALILGYCLSEWDRIEQAMVLVFAGLLEADYFKAERVFWSQQGLFVRRRMILELCKRPGVIDKESHEKITAYMGTIQTLSEKRNMLVHGFWFTDGKSKEIFRSKVRPDMLWLMLMDEKAKFTKHDITSIGEEFTAFRREFVPFAIQYHGQGLQTMVKEKMAIAEALNPGSTVVLGKATGAPLSPGPVVKP